MKKIISYIIIVLIFLLLIFYHQIKVGELTKYKESYIDCADFHEYYVIRTDSLIMIKNDSIKLLEQRNDSLNFIISK